MVLIVIVAMGVYMLFSGKTSILLDIARAQSKDARLVIREPQSAQTVQLLKAATHPDPNPEKGGGDIIVEDGVLIPDRSVFQKESESEMSPNGEISIYIVREGDTLSEIASMFGVSAKTILWANDLQNANKIRPGDDLVILPITGVRHIVKKGDTLKSIAKKYNGDVDDIIAYNQLASAEDIVVGETVVIPDGVMSTPTKKSTASNSKGLANGSGNGSAGFTHPLPGARRTQGIHGYNGVDLAAPAGTPVLAAASGEVIVSRGSGWNGGYGLYVVVKHGNGTQTLYAHLSRTAVQAGGTVSAGQVIGYVGNTGRSTGEHLHFEVRGARNPF